MESLNAGRSPYQRYHITVPTWDFIGSGLALCGWPYNAITTFTTNNTRSFQASVPATSPMDVAPPEAKTSILMTRHP